MDRKDLDALVADIAAGNRRSLARGITLIESTRDTDRARAQAVLTALMARTGGSLRMGISGAPGVGKSSFIEAFGVSAIERGHRVAVLAVDPSSARAGGSILGDKTRMEQLARSPDAYIRPSPSGGSLGGVARRTREAMLLCEAAGYDLVIVETVGVGQSETAVADMTDLFMLLLSPGGGDELQGIKRGIVEIADLLVVNKADGDLLAAAKRARTDYRSALHMLRPDSPLWQPRVLMCSAHTGDGIGDVHGVIAEYREAMSGAGGIPARRARQAVAWMWSEIEDELERRLRSTPSVAAEIESLEAQVAAGDVPAAVAAQRILTAFLGRRTGDA